MSKVLPLEGPHKKHHDHGKNASVPAKGNGPAVPNQHWEKHYSSDYFKDGKHLAGFEWNAMKAKDRTCTHTKVNDEDH